jgi:polyphosphate kinase
MPGRVVDESLAVAEAFPELGEGVRVDYSDEDEPVLRRADGSEVDSWRTRASGW